MKKLFVGMLFVGLQSSKPVTQLPLFKPEPVLNFVKKYLPDNPIIIDAGAYIGNESVMMAKKWPNGTIFSFEPVPEIYDRLVQNSKKVNNIATVPLALSDKIGKARFFVSEEKNAPGKASQSSSLRPPKDHLKYSGTLFKREILVNTITLDEWAKQNNIDHIDFMWLDMQGSELEVLQASPNILKTVKAIFTEVEFVEAYEGQALYQDIKQWLETYGFTMAAKDFEAPMSKHCYGGITWFANALFVKKELLK